MTYIVTGAAGFIGANLLKALNARGIRNVIAVDDLTHGDRFANLVDCEIDDYLDKAEFIDGLERGIFNGAVTALLHQGACSDTTESDGRYMMQNNYRYSRRLLDFCLAQKTPFIYASSAAVYGAHTAFCESPEFEGPLNVYGYSKFLFDQFVRRQQPHFQSQVVGLRYFNVYGPREQHKERMASVVWHFYRQFGSEGRVRLFEGSGGFGAGEQRRDFISVEDVVRVNLDFLDHPDRSGIFNVGTGKATTYNEVAAATINACRAAAGEPRRSVAELVAAGAISYIPFPPALSGKYQSCTEANLARLRAAGYGAPMLGIDEGVARYVERLISGAAFSA